METNDTITSDDGLDRFSYDDGIVRQFFWATLGWGLIAMTVGLVIAGQLAFPALNFGIPEISFGRLRPLHTNAAIFAFTGNAIFAAIYYSTQRLCKTRMFSDVLSRLHFWGWQAIIVAAALTIPFGITQSKEYAELEWPIDIAITVVWAGLFGVNFIMTLLKRRERHLYVAIWFYIATLVTVGLLHVFNSLAIPVSWTKSYSLYAGVQDALMQWWYGHNAVAFFLTTPFLGLMYYFVPKAANQPVFSYRLSIIHFWSLVFIYIWAGPHHLHYTALPEWASTLGMIFSLMLWIPSWGGAINGLLTIRGAWHQVKGDPIIRFFVVGLICYGIATLEGPILAIKSVNIYSHYTDWTVAHVHMGALGWNGFLVFGMVYWLAPRLFQTRLWSEKAANLHFWIGCGGIALYVIPLYIAGIKQGLMWMAIDDHGQLTYPTFMETLTPMMPFYWMRIGGGILYLSGMILCLGNCVMTWMRRPGVYQEQIISAPPLTRDDAVQPPPQSRLAGVTSVADIAHAIDIWQQAHWHRRWERLPLRFTFWVIVAVVVASLFEIIPTFLIKSNVPTLAGIHPYSPLELAGRDIYMAEGCHNCHSQMIRPLYPETQRYGAYSKAGEFVYDHPFLWGSKRIGPDLAREGGKQSHLWQVLHLKDPQQIIPNSIMPPYPWLLHQSLDFTAIPASVAAMAKLGVPYKQELTQAEVMAREQANTLASDIETQGGPPGLADKRIIALLAYLQRLGKDYSSPSQNSNVNGVSSTSIAPASLAGKDQP